MFLFFTDLTPILILKDLLHSPSFYTGVVNAFSSLGIQALGREGLAGGVEMSAVRTERTALRSAVAGHDVPRKFSREPSPFKAGFRLRLLFFQLTLADKPKNQLYLQLILENISFLIMLYGIRIAPYLIFNNSVYYTV